MCSNMSETAAGFLKLAAYRAPSKNKNTRGRRERSQSIFKRQGVQHPGHYLGGRHLVGDPDAVAGRGVLRADGELKIFNGNAQQKTRGNRAFLLAFPTI